MVIFHSYVSLPEGIFAIKHPGPQQLFLFLSLNQTIINQRQLNPRHAAQGLPTTLGQATPTKRLANSSSEMIILV